MNFLEDEDKKLKTDITDLSFKYDIMQENYEALEWGLSQLVLSIERDRVLQEQKRKETWNFFAHTVLGLALGVSTGVIWSKSPNSILVFLFLGALSSIIFLMVLYLIKNRAKKEEDGNDSFNKTL